MKQVFKKTYAEAVHFLEEFLLFLDHFVSWMNFSGFIPKNSASREKSSGDGSKTRSNDRVHFRWLTLLLKSFNNKMAECQIENIWNFLLLFVGAPLSLMLIL